MENTMNLSKGMIATISKMGYSKLTPIQEKTIPQLIEGRDLLGQAETGSGKTAAFSIPLLENIDVQNNKLHALFICPTRALAMQTATVIRKLSGHLQGVKTTALYGGQPISNQIRDLRNGAQIVCGTPGRTLDHIKRNTLKLKNVRTVILDEADEMLDMGFRPDLNAILKAMPEKKQSVLFSATMSKEILEITKEYLNNPVSVKINPGLSVVHTVTQYYSLAREDKKEQAMQDFIESQNSKLTLVFCNTKRKVDKVVRILKARGQASEALHGDVRQRTRDRIMNDFRKGNIKVLIATDVAARGIDVSNIDVVVNYDLPKNPESYVHRIGRTGRAGKSGTAFTMVNDKEKFMIKKFERMLKTKIE
ncbi:MAG: DEAD/DEAH box helicase, partial [Christensenellaceae bacterium]